MANMGTGDPITREYLQGMLLPTDWNAIRRAGPGSRLGGKYFDGEGNFIGPSDLDRQNAQYARSMLGLLDQYGADRLTDLPGNIRAQIPNQGIYISRSPKTLGDQFKEYITNPGVMLALGAGAGMFAGGAGAGAGAAEGAGATGAGAGETLGTGLSASAGGASGLSTGATGASGLSTAGVGAGTSLGAGYFGSEGVGLTAGGSTLAGTVSQGGGGATSMGTQTSTPGGGSYQFPYKNIAGAVLEYMGQRQAGKSAESLLQQAINSDQWRGQQPRYFEPLYQAATKGIGDTPYGRSIAESTGRTASAQGYNMSGNMLADIAKSLNLGTTDYMRALTPLATGRGESPAFSTFGPQISGAKQGQYGAVGYGLENIFQGDQPTSLEQMYGKPKNQNLLQYVGSFA